MQEEPAHCGVLYVMKAWVPNHMWTLISVRAKDTKKALCGRSSTMDRMVRGSGSRNQIDLLKWADFITTTSCSVYLGQSHAKKTFPFETIKTNGSLCWTIDSLLCRRADYGPTTFGCFVVVSVASAKVYGLELSIPLVCKPEMGTLCL